MIRAPPRVAAGRALDRPDGSGGGGLRVCGSRGLGLRGGWGGGGVCDASRVASRRIIDTLTISVWEGGWGL